MCLDQATCQRQVLSVYSWYMVQCPGACCMVSSIYGGGGNTGVGHVDLDLGVFPAELNNLHVLSVQDRVYCGCSGSCYTEAKAYKSFIVRGINRL